MGGLIAAGAIAAAIMAQLITCTQQLDDLEATRNSALNHLIGLQTTAVNHCNALDGIQNLDDGIDNAVIADTDIGINLLNLGLALKSLPAIAC